MNLKKNITINTYLLMLYLFMVFLGDTKDFLGLFNPIIWRAIYVSFGIILSYFYYLQNKNKVQYSDKRYVAVLVILLVSNYFFSGSNYNHVINIFSVVSLYLIIPYVAIDGNRLTSLLLVSFFLISFVQIGDVIRSFFSTDQGYGFLFSSANAVGPLICVMFLFLLYRYYNCGLRNWNIIIVASLYLLFLLYSTHNRSSFLFLIFWLIGYWVLRKKLIKEKLFFLLFFFALFLLGFFMVSIEAINGDDLVSFDVFGKGGSSRGRAEQIYLALSKFDISMFGCGYMVAGEYIADLTGYGIHNMFVGMILEMGIVFSLFYLCIIYYFYKRLNSCILKSFLLSFHIWLFFEPVYSFSSNFVVELLFIFTLQNSFKHKFPQLVNN